jgi:hypothetical protein
MAPPLQPRPRVKVVERRGWERDLPPQDVDKGAVLKQVNPRDLTRNGRHGPANLQREQARPTVTPGKRPKQRGLADRSKPGSAERAAQLVSTGSRSRFAVEDTSGTNRAIQQAWQHGVKSKDVLAACARINSFLENPLFASDEAAAALQVQRVVRGWLVRHARRRGTLLLPVEAQALADVRVLMHNCYGAHVYSLSPTERRCLVTQHFSAKRVQRAWRRHRQPNLARLQPEDSCISVALDDSLLNISSRASQLDVVGASKQAQDAVRCLQRVARGHRARQQCKILRLRLSRAVHFLRFLSSDLTSALTMDIARIRNAAALRVQACWRGMLCRRRLKLCAVANTGAAVTLQRCLRGFRSRRNLAKLREMSLLKRMICTWNKIMWTVYSPSKTGRDDDGASPSGAARFFGDAQATPSDKGVPAPAGHDVSQPGVACPALSGAAKPGDRDSADFGRKRSLWVDGADDSDAVMLDANDTPRTAREGDVGAAWQVVQRGADSGSEGWAVESFGGKAGREAGCEHEDNAHVAIASASTRHASSGGGGGGGGGRGASATVWPESYTSSMCFEPGALKQGDEIPP